MDEDAAEDGSASGSESADDALLEETLEGMGVGGDLPGEGSALGMAAASEYMKAYDDELRDHSELDRMDDSSPEQEAMLYNGFAASLKSQEGRTGPASNILNGLRKGELA